MPKSALGRLVISIAFSVSVFMAGNAAFAYASPRVKPEPPGPQYMSRADHAVVLEISDAVKRKQFAFAKQRATAISDPIAKSLADWMYFMAGDPDADVMAADLFLDSHPDWPAITRIQQKLEETISLNVPADQVLKFFDARDPVSGPGKILLARALLADGDAEAAKIWIRDAWVHNNFRTADERALLSNYGRYLQEDDHIARVDRLLWSRQVTNARRVFSKLPRDERRKAEVRAALLLGAGEAPAMYRNLSEDARRDPGVLHAAIRHFRRRGDEQYAISLANDFAGVNAPLRNPGRIWEERQLLMRWALKEGRFADAYAMAAHHGVEEGGDFAEAEFNAGWIALRFLDQPVRAESHFMALASSVGTPISISRAFYWLGRAAAARGDAELSKSYYQTAAQHYYSYYGQLAAEALGGVAIASKFADTVRPSPADNALFASRPTVAALRMLSDLNLNYEFMVFSYHVDGLLERPGEYVALAKITNGEGAPHLTVRAGKVGIQRNAFAPDVAYPLIYVPDEAKQFVAPEIILGLSRQESEFNPRAYSRAGARGVMQLIPSTAQITARKEGLPYSRSALLDDPVYNMTLGSAHLSHLLERYNGSLIMTFAGYNAGAGRVSQWVERYGDPRAPNIDPIDWVELIPFSETRNYVQRVLENVQVYRGRINDAPIPGRLAADLERGGARGRVATGNSPSPLLMSNAQPIPKRLAALPPATARKASDFKLSLATMRLKPAVAPIEETPTRAAKSYGALIEKRNARAERKAAKRKLADASPPSAADGESEIATKQAKKGSTTDAKPSVLTTNEFDIEDIVLDGAAIEPMASVDQPGSTLNDNTAAPASGNPITDFDKSLEAGAETQPAGAEEAPLTMAPIASGEDEEIFEPVAASALSMSPIASTDDEANETVDEDGFALEDDVIAVEEELEQSQACLAWRAAMIENSGPSEDQTEEIGPSPCE